MISLSRYRPLLAGAALIAVTNAVALGGVAYNRSGAPQSQLPLTERELRLPAQAGLNSENSGLALNLVWRVGHLDAPAANGNPWFYASSAPNWLDAPKLAALGFDVSKPPATPEGRLHYQKLLPREVFLVLEFDGPAYQVALAQARTRGQQEAELQRANPDKPEFTRRAEYAQRQARREESEESRLFVVDAGVDTEQLRARYPERRRYAIVRGEIRVGLIGSGNDERVGGYVSGISIDALHVPLTYRSLFEPLLKDTPRNGDASDPRYQVTVAFGKRLEPWMVAASTLPAR